MASTTDHENPCLRSYLVLQLIAVGAQTVLAQTPPTESKVPVRYEKRFTTDFHIGASWGNGKEPVRGLSTSGSLRTSQVLKTATSDTTNRRKPEVLSVNLPVPTNQDVLISSKVVEDLLSHFGMRFHHDQAGPETRN